MSQWVWDQSHFLLYEVGIRTHQGEARLPAQAILYRFFWALSQEEKPLQKALWNWARDVLKALGREEGGIERLRIALDSEHLRGTRRGRRGEEALVCLSALVHGLGLTLGNHPVTSCEGQATEGLLLRMEGLGVDWVVTGCRTVQPGGSGPDDGARGIPPGGAGEPG